MAKAGTSKPNRAKKEETTEESAKRIKKQADKQQHLLNKAITESSLGWSASSLGL